MDVDLKPNLDFHSFSGSGINDYISGMINCVLHLNGSGEVEVTQRPSIDIIEDATVLSLNDRGRGIYYWEENSKLYIVHDDDLYESTQNSTRIAEVTGIFSTGTERCTMLETVGVPKLIILDAENNKGWEMDSSKNLNQIASNFPTTITHGGAVLDGYLFVMDEDGVIYNSEVDLPETFPPLGFLEAERDNDKGVYLAKHHDNIVAFGTRTIEFLYDAGNATGSPLNRRQDISYNIGCADGKSVWESGDVIYFVGSQSTGELAIYKLENFQIEIISTNSINSYITQGLVYSSLNAVMSGVSAMGNNTLLLTIYILTGAAPGTITPKLTLSYDAVTKKWGLWDTTLNNHTGVPIMASTKRTGGHNKTVSARPGESILANGDIFTVNDKFVPVDTVLGAGGIYEAGIYEIDIYAESASDVGDSIEMLIRTGLTDGQIRNCKFQLSASMLMESTKNSQTLTIKHSDESSNNFGTGRTIDLSLDRKELYQGGRFIKRNYELSYSGNEQIFIEKFDVDVEVGV